MPHSERRPFDNAVYYGAESVGTGLHHMIEVRFGLAYVMFTVRDAQVWSVQISTKDLGAAMPSGIGALIEARLASSNPGRSVSGRAAVGGGGAATSAAGRSVSGRATVGGGGAATSAAGAAPAATAAAGAAPAATAAAGAAPAHIRMFCVTRVLSIPFVFLPPLSAASLHCCVLE
jgi:hypothetical protein